MQRVRAGAPGGKTHAAVLLVGQVDFGAAPDRPEPVGFGDARRAWPVFRPSPTPFRSVDPDLRTKSASRREIHQRTKCLRWSLVCRKTTQKPALQNGNYGAPFFGANG